MWMDPEGHLRPAMSPEYAFQKGNRHFVTPKDLMSAFWRGTAVSAERRNNRKLGSLTSKADVFSLSLNVVLWFGGRLLVVVVSLQTTS